jgi:hypothetical protein
VSYFGHGTELVMRFDTQCLLFLIAWALSQGVAAQPETGVLGALRSGGIRDQRDPLRHADARGTIF